MIFLIRFSSISQTYTLDIYQEKKCNKPIQQEDYCMLIQLFPVDADPTFHQG